MDETTAGENKTGEGTVASSGGKTTAQCSVITVYKAKIGGALRTVTVVWSKTLINHSLSVSVDHSAGGEKAPSTCRVDLKPWPFWGKKGFKSLDTGDHRVDLFWDLRSAKFPAGGGPEPICGYYVALVSGEEVVLLVGDFKKEAYKRTRARPSLDDAAMVSKRDNVFGKKCFSTRARFDGGKREHEIVVENSISGGCEGDAEMWISIDGAVAIHVSNLQWKFRGNETVMVESSPVQVFWDVHDWLFGGAAMGHALFIFKPGAAAAAEDGEEEGREGDLGCLIENGTGREMGSARHNSGGGAPEFCFMLCAWKVE